MLPNQPNSWYNNKKNCISRYIFIFVFRGQLRSLKSKESQNANFIDSLESQLNAKNIALKSSKEYADKLKNQAENHKKGYIAIVANLKLLKE